MDVVLADTSDEEEDFYLNDALVSMGYALFTFEVKSNISCSNSESLSPNTTESSRSNSMQEINNAAVRPRKIKLSPKEINNLIMKQATK